MERFTHSDPLPASRQKYGNLYYNVCWSHTFLQQTNVYIKLVSGLEGTASLKSFESSSVNFTNLPALYSIFYVKGNFFYQVLLVLIQRNLALMIECTNKRGLKSHHGDD